MRFSIHNLVLLSLCLGLPLIAMEEVSSIVIEKEFNYLQAKSDKFFEYPDKINSANPLPKTNRIRSFIERSQNKQLTKKQIIEDAKNINVLIDPKCLNFFEKYLNFKKDNGTAAEKKLYATMSLPFFIYRLYYNRPLSFYGRDDRTFLRPEFAMHYPENNKFYLTNPPGSSTNNKDPRPIGSGYLFFKKADQVYDILADYLSYSEIALAALMGLSCPTFFINDGARSNSAKINSEVPHEIHGIYTGFIGARFEQPSEMEYRHIFITQEQNTSKNGYGKDGQKNPELDLWKKLYDVDYFLSYEEAYNLNIAQPNTRFFITNPYISDEPIEEFFEKNIYKKRLYFSISTFLSNANQRAENAKTKAYVHFSGLGLGAWAEDSIEQAKLVLETVAKIIKKNKFPYISDINFSHFPLLPKDQSIDSVTNGKKLENITIYFSNRDSATQLTGEDKEKLLVASYAWDGNAFPGNEYWLGALTLSDDPAAVCCSLIGELQNPLINGHYIFMSILSTIAKHMPHKKEEMESLMAETQRKYEAEIEEFAKNLGSNVIEVSPTQEEKPQQPGQESQRLIEVARRKKIADMLKDANEKEALKNKNQNQPNASAEGKTSQEKVQEKSNTLEKDVSSQETLPQQPVILQSNNPSTGIWSSIKSFVTSIYSFIFKNYESY